MAKDRTVYTCGGCGYVTAKWLGRCPECGQWNSIVGATVPGGKRKAAGAACDHPPAPVASLSGTAEGRVLTGVGEFDRVLGGGLVPGSAVIIGGDPGIGKSTLLLQATASMAAGGASVLYVSGEESIRQIKLRADRLGALPETLLVWSETNVERVVEEVSARAPDVVVIDSVQALYSGDVDSSPGSVAQVREVASRLIGAAKALDVPVFLVGHVTKDGSIAGPKILEHMVDTVLYFEGDNSHA